MEWSAFNGRQTSGTDYGKLKRQIDVLQGTDWDIILMGDFNGHIGWTIPGNDTNVNQDGKQFLRFV